MLKRIKLFAFALGLMAFVSCENNTTKEQVSVDNEPAREVEVVEEPADEKDVKLKVDANKREIGVETKDIDIDLKGEDSDNEN